MKRVPSVQQMTASVGPTVAHDGKSYQFAFNDQDAKARLEELVRSHVVRDAIRTKRSLGGDDGESHYDAVLDRIDRGYYATLGAGWQKVVASPDGVVMFVLSFLQERHPDATTELAAALLQNEPEQCKAALRVIAPDFLKAVLLQKGAKDGPELAAALAEAIRTMEATWGPATA